MKEQFTLINKEFNLNIKTDNIQQADRFDCEQDFEKLTQLTTLGKNVSILVVGDPLTATTHADFLLRCIQAGIKYKVIHNSNIMTSIGITGLQLYRLGETVSIPFFTESWKPYSFVQKIFKNLKHNLHTLCLLDIKVKELKESDVCKGYTIKDKQPLPPR